MLYVPCKESLSALKGAFLNKMHYYLLLKHHEPSTERGPIQLYGLTPTVTPDNCSYIDVCSS